MTLALFPAADGAVGESDFLLWLPLAPFDLTPDTAPETPPCPYYPGRISGTLTPNRRVDSATATAPGRVESTDSPRRRSDSPSSSPLHRTDTTAPGLPRRRDECR